jgi:serine/threonine protein kinase
MSNEREDSGGMQFGSYLLRQRLGLGGMASVWKAIDETGRTLVIKRILPSLAEDPDFVEMFVREARLSARMRHPNIVRVFSHGDYEGERYLAMEFLHGRDLGSLMQSLAKTGAATPGLGSFIAREACRALVFVHALRDHETGAPLNLIHRDISLSNIMLCFDGAVKLVDFGVAKALADERAQRTQAGVLKGKWAYLAPEQVEGNKIDQRTDIFSLGIVLHEMLTGRRLFKAATGLATLERVRAAKVLPPSATNPAVPLALDAICLKALAKKPADRFQTAVEMLTALDAVVSQLGFGQAQLAVQLAGQFPDEARTFQKAQQATPAQGIEVVYDDGQTELSPQGVTLAELRGEHRTKPFRKVGRAAWRMLLAALLVLVAGGVTGWQLARAHAARLSSSSAKATPARPEQRQMRLSPEAPSPPAAPVPANSYAYDSHTHGG